MQLTYRLWICIATLTILFVACNDQNDSGLTRGSGEVIFVSGIDKPITRVNQEGTQWTAGDQIGIYMTASGTTTTLGYANIPYKAESSAASTAFKPVAAEISYPEDESPVDFIAYYPYTSDLADWIYPIDLSDQSASLVAHDLMYAKADNEENGFTSGSISLGFTHQLTRIILNLVDEDGKALAPDTDGVTIEGMHTTARFDLRTGELNPISTTNSIAPYLTTASSVEAILLPGSIASGQQVAIVVDGHQYVWNMNNSYPGMEMKAGFSYRFKVTVNTSDAEVEAILVDFNGGSIAPWEDGGADNKEEEPVEDLEIPEDYEIITLPSGSQIGSALSTATNSKVAIVLSNGGEYTNSGLKIPGTITSLIIAGEGGVIMPSVNMASTLQLEGDMDLIRIYNVEMYGPYPDSNAGYIINQSALVDIRQISIENCHIHNLRGVVRLQSQPSTIGSYKITNSICHTLGGYCLLTVDAGSVYNIEMIESTIYNLVSRGFYMNKMPDAATISIDHCTFNQGPYYAIAQFSDGGGTLSFTNNIIGLPYDGDDVPQARGVSVRSNGSMAQENGNYYVSDTTWQPGSDIVGEDCGFTADELFAKPANGNFTQSKLTAGDPRWNK